MEEMKKDGNKAKTSGWHQERDVHATAFGVIISYIEDTIIRNKMVLQLTDVNNHYQLLVRDIGGEDYQDAMTAVHNMEVQIGKHFGNRIKIEKGKTKRGNMIYSSALTSDEALRKNIIK